MWLRGEVDYSVAHSGTICALSDVWDLTRLDRGLVRARTRNTPERRQSTSMEHAKLDNSMTYQFCNNLGTQISILLCIGPGERSVRSRVAREHSFYETKLI